MTQPWVSVLMPTYNGAQYLDEALDSILAQQDDQIEVIAVDDGSTDETVAILRRYADRLPLQIVEDGRVANWVTGTNRALRLAGGEYVTILHQDDVWEPQRLRTLKRTVADGTPPALVLHPCWYIDHRGRRIGKVRYPLTEHLTREQAIEHLLVQNFVPVPGALFHRAASLDVGAMDERLWYTSDWDLWMKLAAHGDVRYVPELLAAYRLHPLSLTFTGSGKPEEFRWQLEVVLDKHLQSWLTRNTKGRGVERAARFSVDVNVALAALSNGQPSHLGRLALRFFRLGPPGWRRYLRDSRIVERATSKIKVGLAARRSRR